MATSPAPVVRKPAPKRPAPRPAPRREFYVYGIDFEAVAAGTPANGSIQVQADSNFELQKLSFFADIALGDQEQATRVLPLITVQFTDTGTGRQMFNTPIAIPSIMGDGQIPFILPTTKTFQANASILVTLANYSSATDYNVRISLIGSKVFYYG